jgi:hypothetical protein
MSLALARITWQAVVLPASVLASLLTLAIHPAPPGDPASRAVYGVFVAAACCGLGYVAMRRWSFARHTIGWWSVAAIALAAGLWTNVAYARLWQRAVARYQEQPTIVGSDLTEVARRWLETEPQATPDGLLFAAAGDAAMMWTADSIAANQQRLRLLFLACFPVLSLAIVATAQAIACGTQRSRPTSQQDTTPQRAVRTILFLSAQPTDADSIRVGAEAREVARQLRLSEARDAFAFEQRTAVRPEDLAQALHDLKPALVHLSGHGSETGEICLEDDIGQTIPVSPAALDALFREFAQTIECVVLNACYSQTQAAAIVAHVPYVIGMRREIGDEAAIAFSIGFYQAIGAGRTVPDAYRLGCSMILLKGIPEGSTPALLESRAGRL